MYGVGVDYLLSSDHKPQIQSEDAAKIIRKNRLIITLLAVSVVWLVATIAFVLLRLSLETLSKNMARIHCRHTSFLYCSALFSTQYGGDIR